VIAIIILCWSALTVSRNRAWRTETALWRSAAERAPENSVAWVNLGVSWYEDGKVMKARRAFERALMIDPERAEALTNLGRIYLDLGYREEAIGLLQLALQKAPAAAEVHYNLARAHADLGQYRTAEYHYQQAISLNPNYVNACENLAALYIYHLKEPDPARATLARCLAMKPAPEQLIRIQSLLSLVPP
jgi:tetratricopeptide (TPR) repeat protein